MVNSPSSKKDAAGLQLEDLVGEVVGGDGVAGGQAQLGQSATDRFSIEHGQQGRLADAAVSEQADPLRPAQSLGQRGGSGLRHGEGPLKAI